MLTEILITVSLLHSMLVAWQWRTAVADVNEFVAMTWKISSYVKHGGELAREVCLDVVCGSAAVHHHLINHSDPSTLKYVSKPGIGASSTCVRALVTLMMH